MEYANNAPHPTPIRLRLRGLVGADVGATKDDMIWLNQMRHLAAVLLMLTVGCSREPATPVHAAPRLVASAKTADNFVGEVVAVVGEARTGKTPNVRVTSDFYVACVGDFRFKEPPGKRLFDWHQDIVGTQVKVVGKLEKVYLGERNHLPIIESNYGYFLRDGTWERIEPQQGAAPLPSAPRTGPPEGAR